MKPFSIIITGASRPNLWYSNLIGVKVAAVGARWGAHGLEIESDGLGFVLWDDCEFAPQPEAAELALLRRLANSALELDADGEYASEETLKEYVDSVEALKAWKAGAK